MAPHSRLAAKKKAAHDIEETSNADRCSHSPTDKRIRTAGFLVLPRSKTPLRYDAAKTRIGLVISRRLLSRYGKAYPSCWWMKRETGRLITETLIESPNFEEVLSGGIGRCCWPPTNGMARLRRVRPCRNQKCGYLGLCALGSPPRSASCCRRHELALFLISSQRLGEMLNAAKFLDAVVPKP